MSTTPEVATPLSVWLSRTGTTLAELARKADTTWITVKRYASGEALKRSVGPDGKPAANRHDLEIVRRISDATDGAVTAAQVLGVGDADNEAA